MATTRKARVPMAEQIRLINECRQSGMTDAVNITVRQSRQSGVARATCPD